MGWNYWLSWGITIAAELAAGGVIISFWGELIPSYIWSLLILFVIICFNMIGGKGYGEAEYWLSFIKIITVFIFIIVAILVAAGAVGGKTYGFSNWRDPGAFNNAEPYNNPFANLLSVMLVVGFSYQGTEMVGIAAGETANPAKSVPRAIKNVFWRILLFFMCSIFLIGYVFTLSLPLTIINQHFSPSLTSRLIIPSNDPQLPNEDGDVAVAPFTIVFERANIGPAKHVMNAVLLTVIVSASNSALYCGSRTMMAMAREGKAPRFMGWVNRWGVPVPALALTAAFGLIVAAGAVYSAETVFAWVLGMASVTGFISWSGIGFTQYRFRKAYVAQGRDLSKLPYRAWLYPFSSLFGAFVTAAIAVTSGFIAFTPKFDGITFVQSYINIIFFLVLYLGYKLIKRTSMVPLLECDFETGARWPGPEVLDPEYVEKPTTFAGKAKLAGKRMVQQFIA